MNIEFQILQLESR